MEISFSYVKVFGCAPTGKWECIQHDEGFESNNGWETGTIKGLINYFLLKGHDHNLKCNVKNVLEKVVECFEDGV